MVTSKHINHYKVRTRPRLRRLCADENCDNMFMPSGQFVRFCPTCMERRISKREKKIKESKKEYRFYFNKLIK